MPLSIDTIGEDEKNSAEQKAFLTSRHLNKTANQFGFPI